MKGGGYKKTEIPLYVGITMATDGRPTFHPA